MACSQQQSQQEQEQGQVPAVAAAAVLQVCEETPASATVLGYDFNDGIDLEKVLASYGRVGFQSTNFGNAVDEVNRMLRWRLSDEAPTEEESDEYKDPAVRAQVKCTIFLSYTSNLISSGAREILRFLAQHKLVDVIVTTAGGIEEDFIKCLAPTYLGEFSTSGKELRLKGLNRVGNMLVPNSNYVQFERWLGPVLDAMVDEQAADGTVWTPSKMIRRFGQEIAKPLAPTEEDPAPAKIDFESSVYYWAAKNDIPVFCPAITDGSIGDMVYFHSYTKPGLVIDIAGDIRGINDLAVNAKKTGVLILGGGLIKHHVLNANLMRNGADFSVFVNTGQEFDGSDSGARPDEAVSWGKLKIQSKPVKIYAEATLILPLLVAQTFAKYHFARLEQKQ